jgi:hypothetical protein
MLMGPGAYRPTYLMRWPVCPSSVSVMFSRKPARTTSHWWGGWLMGWWGGWVWMSVSGRVVEWAVGWLGMDVSGQEYRGVALVGGLLVSRYQRWRESQ